MQHEMQHEFCRPLWIDIPLHMLYDTDVNLIHVRKYISCLLRQAHTDPGMGLMHL